MDLDSKPDYFTAPDTPEDESRDNVIRFEQAQLPRTEQQPEPKQPRRRRGRRILCGSVLVLFAVVGIAVWIRYFNPYETDMHESGYVIDFKRQGYVFKTWEGSMVVNSSLTDTTRVYSRDFTFSVDNDDVAARLSALKDSGRLVTVGYKRYWGVLPWRGSSQCIVTSVNIK